MVMLIGGVKMKFVDWVIKGYDRAAAVNLSRSGINPLVSVFLASRGITTVEAAEKFLTDDLGLICDPFLLKIWILPYKGLTGH
jgi:hypothetical protein